MRPLFRLLTYLGAYRRNLLLSIIFMLMATGTTLVQPRLVEWVIDFGVGGRDGRILWLGTLGLLGTATVGGLLHLASGILVSYSGQGMSYGIRNDVFRSILAFSFGNLDRHRTGELIVRSTSDVNTVQMFVRMGFMLMLQSLAMLVGSLILMFTMNPGLARIMLMIFAVTILLFFLLAAVIRPLIMRVRERLDEMNNALQENLAGAKLVRAFARQRHESNRFEARNRAYLEIALRAGYITALAFPFLFFLGQLALVAVTYYGGLTVIQQVDTPLTERLTLGQLVAFNEYAMLAMWPILALGMTLQFMARAAASATRIVEVLDESPDIAEPPRPQALADGDSSIEFRDVSFSFGHGEPALSDINLRIASGEVVGLIGRTGSGKSTLAALIPRFYDPGKGAVLIGGVDVKQVKLAELRQKIVLVLQESVLLSGSIRDNIAYGLRANNHDGQAALDTRLGRAAALARATEFIEAKSLGWNEPVGERGAGLSGGQRQRVAIARAIVRDPDILILDDVTSALDATTEREVVAGLQREMRGKTVIVISQKINTVRQANRILVMDDGRLVGAGTHDELLAGNQIYREIYQTQNTELRL